MFLEPKTLIVVYKDELMLNLLKKLVETNDDTEDGGVKGVTDGSVRIVAWTEKVWKDQKKAGNIKNKVLFLGNLKEAKNIVPLIDVKYDEFGITYGWAGNQAVLQAEPVKLFDTERYNQFITALTGYPVPAVLKAKTAKEPVDSKEVVPVKEKKKPEILNQVDAILNPIGHFAVEVGSKVGENVGKAVAINKIEKQQLFLGIMRLYENDLEQYMKS